MWPLGVPSSYLHGRCWTPLQSSPNFQCFFISPWLVSNCLSFPLFYPTSPFTAFSFEFLLANQNLSADCSWYISIFILGICSSHDLDFGGPTVHFPIHFSLVTFFSLCFCDCLKLLSCSFSTVLWLTSKSRKKTTYY